MSRGRSFGQNRCCARQVPRWCRSRTEYPARMPKALRLQGKLRSSFRASRRHRESRISQGHVDLDLFHGQACVELAAFLARVDRERVVDTVDLLVVAEQSLAVANRAADGALGFYFELQE